MDAQAHLRRTRRMPSTSRQTIMERAARARAAVDHRRVSDGFLHAGLALSLNGDEDHLLGYEAKAFWEELDIPALREDLWNEIRHAVQAGRLVSMRQYHEVL
eukprot:13967452-Alexandrium_andersonii.AAC.1